MGGGCAGPPASPITSAMPRLPGNSEIRFGGYNDQICQSIDIGPENAGIAVTMEVSPAQGIVGSAVLKTVTDEAGKASGSWALQPGIDGNWSVQVSATLPSGPATANSQIGTGMTGDKNGDHHDPCPTMP